MFATKLPLNSMFKEALAKLTGTRKPVYSMPLVTWTNRKLLGGRHQQLQYQNYFKARKKLNQFAKISFTTPHWARHFPLVKCPFFNSRELSELTYAALSFLCSVSTFLAVSKNVLLSPFSLLPYFVSTGSPAMILAAFSSSSYIK